VTPVVPMNGFAQEPEELRRSMGAAAERVLASHHYVLGDEVRSFESRWAEVSGAAHCVGVGNGLDALEISLRALGIGPGDEVITTPMTAFATVLAVIRAGATPVLADIDPTTALLDPASVERCLTPRTRAILLVHLYGQVRGLAGWRDLAARHGIELVEDCAQAHLAVEDGLPAGTAGRISAFSFYPTKNLGAVGDAGAVVTSDEGLATYARRARNYGQVDRYEHVLLGLNSRLDELQAALLLARLEWLEPFTERRRAVAARYDADLDSPAVRLLAAPTSPQAHARHLYVVTTDDRDRLARHLDERGIQTLIHYPIPAEEQPPTRSLMRDPAGLPATEAHARTCLSLPCHPQLTDDEVDRVIAAVNDYRG
jgi:dTDP-4-amino-4,6-dideoxygalactose transaminase